MLRGVSLNYVSYFSASDLKCALLEATIFSASPGVAEAINLQPEKGKAKPYQVRQARKVLQKNLLL